jgi:putative membrane protein
MSGGTQWFRLDPIRRSTVIRAMDQADQALKKPAEKLAETGKTVERASEKVAETGKTVERTTKKVSAETNRQTMLAADRTLLATERTYAAWVRTALSSLAAGVGARALLEGVIPLWLARLTGSVLILFAGFCLVAAVWRHVWRPVPPPPTDLRPVPRLLLVPMSVFLLLVALAALLGIWAA